jgi:hypothetical protein
MNRQPTLAEILSDDTGRIRAEVADLLMQPQARVHPQQRVRQPQRAHWGRRFLVANFIILLFFSAIAAFSNSRPRRPEPIEVTQQVFAPAPVQARPAAPMEQPVEDGITVEAKARNTEANSNPTTRPWSVPTWQTGQVIGDVVRVRAQPNLEAEVVSMAERGVILKVVSFNDGWYQVERDDHRPGYIFGAYLQPLDFDPAPYRVAITKADQSKVLVKEVDQPLYFQALRPYGQTTWILKDDVEIYR